MENIRKMRVADIPGGAVVELRFKNPASVDRYYFTKTLNENPSFPAEKYGKWAVSLRSVRATFPKYGSFVNDDDTFDVVITVP